MLKYTVSSKKETKFESFAFSNFYVSPDLTYISGLTDYETGLVNGEKVLIKSPYLKGDEINTINVECVTLKGNVVVNVILPVYTIVNRIKLSVESDGVNCFYYENNRKVIVEDCDYEDDYIFKDVTQKYVIYNGDISYFFNSESGDTSGYLINHRFYKAAFNDLYVKIETYLPIEDGKLTVGNYVYDAEFNNNSSKPILRLNNTKEPIQGEQLLGIYDKKYANKTSDGQYYEYGVYSISDDNNGILIKDYEPSKWKNVRKFNIIKGDNTKLTPGDVLYGGYKHYITYKDNNYYLSDIFLDERYVGFGVLINDKFYPELPGYVDDEIYEYHKDLESNESCIYIEEEDLTLEVKESLVSFTEGGKFIIFIDENENNDIVEGNYINAKSNSPVKIVKSVETDENDLSYITYNGNRYDVYPHACDYVAIGDFNHKLTYLNDERTSASTIINGETLFFDVISDGTKAVLSNEVYYMSGVNESGNTIIEFGINNTPYDIIENSGATINGISYPISMSTTVIEEDGEESLYTSYYVEFYDMIDANFLITEINGSSSYVCYPVVNNDLYDDYEIDEIQREICSSVVENYKSFTFSLRRDTFGFNEVKPENGLVYSMSATKPYTLSDSYLLENKIEIYRIQNFLSFNFPIVNRMANNIMKEDMVKTGLVNYAMGGSINSITDMEKDIYYPVYLNGGNYLPILELRFNLHFRTRNLENWKVIEDDREFSTDSTNNYQMSNWFVTDYKYYKEMYRSQYETILKRLHNSSDLLGLLNFSTSEIANQAKKISKSFLRLSFYSTDNPKTQVLLATSTIFFDETKTFRKYSDSHRNSDLTYINIDSVQKNIYLPSDEPIQETGKTISNLSEVVYDGYISDGLRLSSRFVVNDKYLTDTSSDGYYIYMFKEYAKKMHETTIYLKVEFNHAGIGKTIQFMLPRKDDGTPLYLHEISDVEKLKEGFKMQDIYKQIYIPINVIYDDKSNKYVYYLPDSIRENETLGVENEIMEFNLFETKFANEAIVQYV